MQNTLNISLKPYKFQFMILLFDLKKTEFLKIFLKAFLRKNKTLNIYKIILSLLLKFIFGLKKISKN